MANNLNSKGNWMRDRLPKPVRSVLRDGRAVLRSGLLGLRHRGVRPTTLGDGTRLLVDPNRRWIDRNLVVHGHYELGTLALMRRLLSPGDCFLDVGANIGLMAMTGARCVGPTGRVVAFEPDMINFSRLAWAREANDVPHVLPMPLALGAGTGSGSLHRSPGADGGLTSLKPIDGFVAGETVPVSTLDAVDAALQLARVAVMKIDVEGFESEVVKGGMGLINREKPAIIMELINDEAVAAARRLTEIGYRAFLTEGKGARDVTWLRPCEPQMLEHDNMVFIHPSNQSRLASAGLAVLEDR